MPYIAWGDHLGEPAHYLGYPVDQGSYPEPHPFCGYCGWFPSHFLPQHPGALSLLQHRHLSLQFSDHPGRKQHNYSSELVHCQPGVGSAGRIRRPHIHILLGLHIPGFIEDRDNDRNCYSGGADQVHPQASGHIPLTVQKVQDPCRAVKIDGAQSLLRIRGHHCPHHPSRILCLI